jgi:hypothetical protein
MTNGHPSWINANYAIWYIDNFNLGTEKDWIVGRVEDRGSNRGSGWIFGDQGSTCPFSIMSENWKIWYNGQYNSQFTGVSFTCSQALDVKVLITGPCV